MNYWCSLIFFSVWAASPNKDSFTVCMQGLSGFAFIVISLDTAMGLYRHRNDKVE